MAKTSDRFSSIEPRFGQHWGNLPVLHDDQISVLAYSYRELDYSEECVPLATEPQTEATQPKHQDIRPSKETNVSQSSEGSQAHLVASNKSPLYNPDSAQFLWEPTRELASFIDKQFRRKMSYDRVYEILDNYSITSVDFLITYKTQQLPREVETDNWRPRNFKRCFGTSNPIPLYSSSTSHSCHKMIGFKSFSYTDVDAEALKLLSLRAIKKIPFNSANNGPLTAAWLRHKLRKSLLDPSSSRSGKLHRHLGGCLPRHLEGPSLLEALTNTAHKVSTSFCIFRSQRYRGSWNHVLVQGFHRITICFFNLSPGRERFL